MKLKIDTSIYKTGKTQTRRKVNKKKDCGCDWSSYPEVHFCEVHFEKAKKVLVEEE